MEANACGDSFQSMQLCFGLVACIPHYRYVIGVVGVGDTNSGSWVSWRKRDKNINSSNQYEIQKVHSTKELISLAMEPEVEGDTNFNWCTQTNPKRLGKRLDYLEIRREVETIQTTASIRSARALRIFEDTCGDRVSLKSSVIPQFLQARKNF